LVSEEGHYEAVVPRPRINLIIYHGVLAPNARVRAAVVAFGVPAAVTPAPNATDVSRETGIPGSTAPPSLMQSVAGGPGRRLHEIISGQGNPLSRTVTTILKVEVDKGNNATDSGLLTTDSIDLRLN
jgi:hypothetical protein